MYAQQQNPFAQRAQNFFQNFAQRSPIRINPITPQNAPWAKWLQPPQQHQQTNVGTMPQLSVDPVGSTMPNVSVVQQANPWLQRGWGMLPQPIQTGLQNMWSQVQPYFTQPPAVQGYQPYTDAVQRMFSPDVYQNVLNRVGQALSLPGTALTGGLYGLVR